MTNFSIEELKAAWLALWDTDASALWAAINMELARRLSRDEYTALTDGRKAQ